MQKSEIKLSFQWKIRIVFCLLSVSLTSLGVYFFYMASYQTTFGLLRKNLRDVGNMGALLFDHESREAIKRLKARAIKEAIFDKQAIQSLPLGGTIKSIPPEKVKELHSSKDFQIILHRLEMINYASFKEAMPLLENYQTDPTGFAEGMMASYLEIDLLPIFPDSTGMYLVSSFPEPIGNIWPGNPIGNVFRAFVPLTSLQKKIYVHNDLIKDEFYQALCGTVPIIDENNQTIAILGIDYSVGVELNKLNKLKWICFALIAGALILSILLSFIISKFLNNPLKLLSDGVKEIGKGNLQTRVSIRLNDEFHILAQEFNNMAQNLQKITVSRNELEKEFKEKEQIEKKRQKAIRDLTTALDEIKTLRGIVPICSNCKKIRDDKGYWNLLENYIEKHSEASFSHGMCPECSEKFYGKQDWYIRMKNKKK